MRGHIRKRYKDSWSVVIHMGKDPNTGKPKYKWFTVKGSEDDAEKFLTEKLRQLDTNMYTDPGKMTVAEYLRKWVKNYCEPNLAKSTLIRNRGIVENHLIPALGRYQLAKLKPLHIQEYYTHALKYGRIDGKGEALSPTTVLYHHRVLHEALKHAVQWQLLTMNPSDAVKPPKKNKPQAKTLDKQEVDILLNEAKGGPLYIPVLIAIHTGMRRGEIIALEWKDVDLKAGIIHVKKSIHWDAETKKHITKRTKNEKNRRVDIIMPVVDELKRWKKEQKNNRKACGTGCEINDYICTHPDGRMISLDYCTKAFIRLARSCRFDISFHDLRHTHATLMMQMGVPAKVVAERLGHTDIKITIDTYSHVSAGVQRDAVMKWENLFKKSND